MHKEMEVRSNAEGKVQRLATQLDGQLLSSIGTSGGTLQNKGEITGRKKNTNTTDSLQNVHKNLEPVKIDPYVSLSFKVIA